MSRQDQFERKNGGGFDAVEFDEHPDRYVSNFAKKFAPYASVIVNGIYWSPETPRLLTIPDAKALLTPESNSSQMWVPSSKGETEKNVFFLLIIYDLLDHFESTGLVENLISGYGII